MAQSSTPHPPTPRIYTGLALHGLNICTYDYWWIIKSFFAIIFRHTVEHWLCAKSSKQNVPLTTFSNWKSGTNKYVGCMFFDKEMIAETVNN